ncbi:hypothetical protein, partial [Methylophaga sp. SB9B]|uniref:hypothetical protein n=1 Tax=Methylophaga sp. SB9B TaxID=2570356 RepID=UPI001B3C17CA
KTWIHIDPHNGAVIESLDQNRRIARWLFNLLHSWDWQPLLERDFTGKSNYPIQSWWTDYLYQRYSDRLAQTKKKNTKIPR